MNVNTYNTKDYENKRNWTIGQNKPNSNPISSKPKMNLKSNLATPAISQTKRIPCPVGLKRISLYAKSHGS